MAIPNKTKSSTSRSSAKATAPAAPAAHSHSDLEGKIVALEEKLADALKKVAALEAQCAAKSAAPAADSSGRDEDLRQELKKYFTSAFNRNLPTVLPKL